MGVFTPLAVRIGSLEFLPRFLPQITATDKALQRVSRGHLSLLRLAGLPTITITVPARSSGLPRTTPLLAVPRNGDWLIAGSNFGQPTRPLWVGNLEAAGAAEVRVGPTTTSMTARRLTGTDRDAAWEAMCATWPNFSLYEARTDRRIEVFELVDDAAASS